VATTSTEPDPRLVRRLSTILPSQLGAESRWRILERDIRTPMNFTLDEATRQLGRDDFVVVWVDGGLPELFALTGLRKPVVVFATRYLDLSAYVRKLFDEGVLADFRRELAERAALKIVAELLLRNGQGDLAATFFIRSALGKRIFIPDADWLEQLEVEPIGEAYMAVWFYGLLHELGHLQPPIDHATGPFSEAAIDEAVRRALRSFEWQEDIDLGQVLAEAARDPSHPISARHLKDEVAADVFASAVLLQATVSIMRGVERDFDPVRFIREAGMFLVVVSFIERCSSAAALVGKGESRGALLRHLVHPAGYVVRGQATQWYLASAMATFGQPESDPEPERVNAWFEVIDEVTEAVEPAVSQMDSGFADALRFALGPVPPTKGDLGRFAEQIHESAPLQLETTRFTATADTLGTSSELLGWLCRV
jgi:hypothetical protein